MHKNVYIETERLIIRNLELSDASGMFALDSDADVHKFLGNNPIQKIEQAEEIIQTIRQQYIDYGMGRLAVMTKNTHDFVGWTGIKYEKELREDFNYYDLGYRFRKEYWGKGIATETSIASLKHGFDTLNLTEIFAAAEVAHIASNKVLKKVGLNQIEVFEFDDTPHNWYRITKSEWLQQKQNKT